MYTISVFRPDLCTHLDYRAKKTGVVEVLFFIIEFFKTKQVIVWEQMWSRVKFVLKAST